MSTPGRRGPAAKLDRTVPAPIRPVTSVRLMNGDIAHGRFACNKVQYRIIKQIFLIISGYALTEGVRMNMVAINKTYCGVSIIIRNGKGVARRGREILVEIEGESHTQLCATLKAHVDDYRSHQWCSENGRPNLEEPVRRGLMQISADFGRDVLRSLEAHERKWGCRCFVRFGITGVVAEGRSGSPNYQIEAEDGNRTATFRHNHQEFDTADGSFNDGNITERLSRHDIEDLWLL